jgi:hypothetical protein
MLVPIGMSICRTSVQSQGMLLNPAALERGKQIHTEFTKAGLYLDVCLMNAFISMYTRCESHREAIDIFPLI